MSANDREQDAMQVTVERFLCSKGEDALHIAMDAQAQFWDDWTARRAWEAVEHVIRWPLSSGESQFSRVESLGPRVKARLYGDYLKNQFNERGDLLTPFLIDEDRLLVLLKREAGFTEEQFVETFGVYGRIKRQLAFYQERYARPSFE